MRSTFVRGLFVEHQIDMKLANMARNPSQTKDDVGKILYRVWVPGGREQDKAVRVRFSRDAGCPRGDQDEVQYPGCHWCRPGQA
jgi:hypothetical protein